MLPAQLPNFLAHRGHQSDIAQDDRDACCARTGEGRVLVRELQIRRTMGVCGLGPAVAGGLQSQEPQLPDRVVARCGGMVLGRGVKWVAIGPLRAKPREVAHDRTGDSPTCQVSPCGQLLPGRRGCANDHAAAGRGHGAQARALSHVRRCARRFQRAVACTTGSGVAPGARWAARDAAERSACTLGGRLVTEYPVGARRLALGTTG